VLGYLHGGVAATRVDLDAEEDGSSRFDFFSRRPRLVSALETIAIALRHLVAEGQDNMQSSTYHDIVHTTPPTVST
jgi:hypothetical protein